MPRKARVPDEHIIRLNDLGLSLEQIGNMLNYHPTTIKVRLMQLGINSADTRRTFMAKIYQRLSVAQREWLSDQLHLGQPIDAWLTGLIIEKYNQRKTWQKIAPSNGTKTQSAPTEKN